MIFSKYSYFLALLVSFGYTFSMENTFKDYTITDFDSGRDTADFHEICKEQWDKIFIGKPFDPQIADTFVKLYSPQDATQVLRYNDKTVGFMTYHIMNNGQDLYMETGAISKAHQQQGIGTSFLPSIIKKAKELNVNAIILDVEKNNEPMLKLCKRFGFEKERDSIGGKAVALKKKIDKNQVEAGELK